MNFSCMDTSKIWNRGAEALPLLHSVAEDAVVVAAAAAASAAAADSPPPGRRRTGSIQLQQVASGVKKLLRALVKHLCMLWGVFGLLLQQQPLVLLLACMHCAFNAAMQGTSLSFVKHQLGFSHDQVSLLSVSSS